MRASTGDPHPHPPGPSTYMRSQSCCACSSSSISRCSRAGKAASKRTSSSKTTDRSKPWDTIWGEGIEVQAYPSTTLGHTGAMTLQDTPLPQVLQTTAMLMESLPNASGPLGTPWLLWPHTSFQIL